jgi:uncharacterized membrane protein YjjP (DUF1212 family)
MKRLTEFQMRLTLVMLRHGYGVEDIAVRLANGSRAGASELLPMVRGIVVTLRKMGKLSALVRG